MAEGPVAGRLTGINPLERNAVVVDLVAERFGPKATMPFAFTQQDWTVERWLPRPR